MSALNDLPPATQAAADGLSAAVNHNGNVPPIARSQPPKNWLKRLVTEPLVHFLLIGAMIFGLHTYVERVVNPDDSYLIQVSPQLVNQVSTLWERQ